MRFITFKKLEGKNFLSFGNTPVTIDLKPGVNAITGSNLDKEDSANGCGKSAITEILYFAIYGNTLREIGNDFITNSFTKGDCEVSLTFDATFNNNTDTYKIVRKLNPTKCSLYKNNEDITRSTLAKTNKLIQDLLRTPATVFQHSVIMSANNAQPFMALKKTDRRKFVESVLGLEVFTAMVLKARDDYSIAKKDYEINYNKFEQTQTELVFNKSQFENYEANKQERLKRLEEKKKKIEGDILSLKEKLHPESALDFSVYDKDIKTTAALSDDCGLRIADMQGKYHRTQAEISSLNKQIKELQTEKQTCPTCKRDYSAEHTSHIVASIDEKQKKIEQIKTFEDKIVTAIKELQQKAQVAETLNETAKKSKALVERQIAENKSVLASIGHLSTNITDIEDDIAQIRQEQNNELKGKLVSLTKSFNELDKKVQTLNNDLNVLEAVKFVISEEGIKSFIVKKILQVLNARLAYYLKKLETNCLCRFNEFFEEEIIDEKKQSKSYFNFSGGERKRIDLACLFAFADIRRLQGDVNFSTVFYDELLDSSLDDKGVHLTLKILRERYQENNESCYIITHRGNHVVTKAEHNIHVTKQNGISTVLC